LTEPLSWPNTKLVTQDAVEAVREYVPTVLAGPPGTARTTPSN
jgi:hypothetical protein